MGVRDHVLHSGEGPVRCVRWCGALIAWANDVGVKLYDSGAHTRIAFVDRPAGSPPPDAFPPRLVWESEKTLIIAWADCVKVARIVRAPACGSGAAVAHPPPTPPHRRACAPSARRRLRRRWSRAWWAAWALRA